MKTEKSVTTTTIIRSEFYVVTFQENGGTVAGTVESRHQTALRHPYETMLGRHMEVREKLTFMGRAELESLKELLENFLAPKESSP